MADFDQVIEWMDQRLGPGSYKQEPGHVWFWKGSTQVHVTLDPSTSEPQLLRVWADVTKDSTINLDLAMSLLDLNHCVDFGAVAWDSEQRLLRFGVNTVADGLNQAHFGIYLDYVQEQSDLIDDLIVCGYGGSTSLHSQP